MEKLLILPLIMLPAALSVYCYRRPLKASYIKRVTTLGSTCSVLSWSSFMGWVFAGISLLQPVTYILIVASMGLFALIMGDIDDEDKGGQRDVFPKDPEFDWPDFEDKFYKEIKTKKRDLINR